MEWSNFIDRIYGELRDGVAFDNFRRAIVTEQDLTEVTALGLRDIFANFFGMRPQSDLTFKHVTFRKGPTEKDKKAYSIAKKDRWVFFHDVFYAPDILIQDPNTKDNILPIEVKLIKGDNQSPSQSIATAIGQAIIYTTRYPCSIVFLGIHRSAKWGRYKFRSKPNEIENVFWNKLKQMNIRVVMGPVGLENSIKV